MESAAVVGRRLRVVRELYSAPNGCRVFRVSDVHAPHQPEYALKQVSFGTPEGPRAVMHEAGVRTGLARDWAPDGQLLAVENYVGGQRSGLQQTWHTTGLRKGVGTFVADQLTGERFVWDESGQLMEQLSGVYEKGRKVGPLDEAARTRASELAGAAAPLPVESESPDPFLDYDLNGELREG